MQQHKNIMNITINFQDKQYTLQEFISLRNSLPEAHPDKLVMTEMIREIQMPVFNFLKGHSNHSGMCEQPLP